MLRSFVVIFILCVALISKREFVVSKRTTSQTFVKTLFVNQTKTVCHNVKIHVGSIDDSRCSSNVQCFWARQAKVQLTLSKKAISSALELILGAQSQSSDQVILFNASYKVTLRNVFPYPGTNNSPSKAIIEIICPEKLR